MRRTMMPVMFSWLIMTLPMPRRRAQRPIQRVVERSETSRVSGAIFSIRRLIRTRLNISE